MQNEETAAQVFPPDGARIEFPQSFELRVIYAAEAAHRIRDDIAAVFSRFCVPCSRLADVPTKPGRYARISASVTFDTLERMRAVYAALGALEGVKALI
jgi:putative lipoic acid-binding regulatory protein